MASQVEWENTGTFGPEQADLDVAYATSLPPEASLTWVEARLAEIQSHLANLGAGRNLLIPVYHLPRVVLVQILSWVALSYPSSKSEKDVYRYPIAQTKDLLHISQACKLFREPALERPELWTRVNLKYPGLAKMFLERSGDKPVAVFLYPPHPAGYTLKYLTPLEASTVEMLRPHLSRITHLDLMFTMHTRYGYIDGNPLTMHMPALETLQLRNSREEADIKTSESDSPQVPPPIFSTPNDPYLKLRKVTLVSINVLWDSSLFNGLTELDLSHQNYEHAPKVEEFLVVLEKCPGLEKLHLRNSGPKGISDSLPAPGITKSVQLSRLQDLSITHDSDRYMDIPLLLSAISIPPSTKIHIQCNEVVEPVIRFSQLFHPEHPFLAQLPKYRIFKHLHSFTFFHFRLIDEPNGGCLSFRINRHDKSVQTAASVLDFFKTFGESAQYAEIISGTDCNPWSEVLETLPNVESMRLKREPDYANCTAALSSKVCPNLKRLAFEHCSLTAEHQLEWLAALKTRAGNGMKLEEFNLTFTTGGELLTPGVVDVFKLYTGRFLYQRV